MPNLRSKKTWKAIALSMLTFIALYFSLSDQAEAEFLDLQECLQHQFETAPDDMTIGQIRNECIGIMALAEKTEVEEAKSEGPVETRLRIDEKNILKPFTIMAHRQNYFLLGAYNFQGYSSDEFQNAFPNDDIELKDTEAQFQLSIKTPLALDLFDSGVGIWGAYTVRSFWQVFNDDLSSPFRETNHEPEGWVQMRPDWEFMGFKTSALAAGINHQSNGRAEPLSRSWNRLFVKIIVEKGNFVAALKPWYRIEESSDDDDNPDITDFLGHAELRMGYKYKDHVFTFMSRNNIESGFSEGAVELGWSFPIFDYPFLKGYLQYFSGYGESMIDYDRYVNRLGAGILLTDLL